MPACIYKCIHAKVHPCITSLTVINVISCNKIWSKDKIYCWRLLLNSKDLILSKCQKWSKTIHSLLLVQVITDVENVTLNFTRFAAIGIRLLWFIWCSYNLLLLLFLYGCNMLGCRRTILTWREKDTASPHLSITGANLG